jgi:large repetitive protein
MQCSSARASILAHIPQWLVAVLLISGSVALQAAVPPIITGINPNRGSVGGGTVVVISGEGFTGTTSVTFGGAAAGFTVNNDNQITATTPAQPAGVYDVVVTTPEASATLTDGFSYGNVPASRADEYSTPFNTPLQIFAPGVLSNDNNSGGGAMTAELIVGPSNGTLVFNADGSFTYTPNTGFSGTETLKYRAINATGNGNIVSITITIAVPTTAQPATGLFVLSIFNNEVTFRWTPPVTGLAPTDYILEAGAGPGAVQGSVSTGSTFPIFTFTAPTGALFYRIRTVSGSSISGPSNEIQVFVNVPVVPSPPANLVGLVNGSRSPGATRLAVGRRPAWSSMSRDQSRRRFRSG